MKSCEWSFTLWVLKFIDVSVVTKCCKEKHNMNQFSIILLFVTASAEDVYDLSEGSNWRLRGLCSEFTPLEVRKSKDGHWQLFVFDTQTEGEQEQLLATLVKGETTAGVKSAGRKDSPGFGKLPVHPESPLGLQRWPHYLTL